MSASHAHGRSRRQKRPMASHAGVRALDHHPQLPSPIRSLPHHHHTTQPAFVCPKLHSCLRSPPVEAPADPSRAQYTSRTPSYWQSTSRGASTTVPSLPTPIERTEIAGRYGKHTQPIAASCKATTPPQSNPTTLDPQAPSLLLCFVAFAADKTQKLRTEQAILDPERLIRSPPLVGPYHHDFRNHQPASSDQSEVSGHA